MRMELLPYILAMLTYYVENLDTTNELFWYSMPAWFWRAWQVHLDLLAFPGSSLPSNPHWGIWQWFCGASNKSWIRCIGSHLVFYTIGPSLGTRTDRHDELHKWAHWHEEVYVFQHVWKRDIRFCIVTSVMYMRAGIFAKTYPCSYCAGHMREYTKEK